MEDWWKVIGMDGAHVNAEMLRMAFWALEFKYDALSRSYLDLQDGDSRESALSDELCRVKDARDLFLWLLEMENGKEG